MTDLSTASTLIKQFGRDARVIDLQSVGGGCIHEAQLLTLDDGTKLFLKQSNTTDPTVFSAERRGLEALAAGLEAIDLAAEGIRVPAVIGDGALGAGGCFLLLEAIDRGSPGDGFFEGFGRDLARLHRSATADSWGFEADNFIGATPQPNARVDDWPEFWRQHRLRFQLELARRRGLTDPTLDRLGDRLLERLGDILAIDEPPSLLHGDLWSGNFMADSAGRPVIFDPAVYYGHREADLAMTRLFGGFPPAFYRAYESIWPLADGYQRRLPVYELYHLLNHLNLFGSSYRSQCVATLERCV